MSFSFFLQAAAGITSGCFSGPLPPGQEVVVLVANGHEHLVRILPRLPAGDILDVVAFQIRALVAAKPAGEAVAFEDLSLLRLPQRVRVIVPESPAASVDVGLLLCGLIEIQMCHGIFFLRL